MAIDLSTYGGTLLEKGFPGGVADFQPAVIISKRNDQAVAIPAGGLVVRSAADDTCKLVSADGDKILGFAVRSAIYTYNANGTDPGYAQNIMLSILQDGYMWLTAAEATTRGDAVLSITASKTLGSTTGGAAGAGRVDTGAKWEESVTAGQIALAHVKNLG